MEQQQLKSLIWNPILRQYLVNAPNRMNRREGTNECPFCADITCSLQPEKHTWSSTAVTIIVHLPSSR